MNYVRYVSVQMKRETKSFNPLLRKKCVFKANWIEKWFLFLSAVDLEVLKKCPGEKQKYSAIGATLLVPFLFGTIAACYAVWCVW